MNLLSIVLQAQSGGGNWSMILMLVVVFAIIYFLVILPQQKRKKEQLDEMQGDRVPQNEKQEEQEKRLIKRYFEPERRISQLRQEIEQLQRGGGNNTGAAVGGGMAKGTFNVIGSVLGATGLPGGGLVKAAMSGMGSIADKGIKAGANAANNATNNAEIQRKKAEIQKIQSGDVDRGISDTYMDTIVENLVPDDLYEKALDSLMIDESQIKGVKPVYLEDYYIDENDENQLIARGRDGIDRSPIYQATWLFGTTKQLCVYQYIFDVETGADNETTKKYFWKNITELSNSTEIVRGNKKKYFVIKVANGDYKFAYKDNDDVKRSIRGLNAYYDINNG